ncbi:hypothetical protein BRD00_15310 [Halobacteriales archaeon QS_8_69_26]|nr:MAG: hypothetical protein BRD00_15310 [Halobacteriales archaeon QS_8_69_26]
MTGEDPAGLSRPDTGAATHRLTKRGTDAERIEAENRLAEAALEAGDRASLAIEEWVTEHRAEAVERLAELAEERTGEAAAGSADREYLVDLPEGADAVLAVLAVPDEERESTGPAGEMSWRVWGIRDLLVTLDGEWVYYSIPHEGQQYANAEASPSFPEAASAALSEFPSALAPTEPRVEWDDGEYAVLTDEVRLAGEALDLDRMRRVVVDEDRSEVVFDWVSDAERAEEIDNELVRSAARVLVAGLGSFTDPVEPPHRVRLDDPGTVRTVEDALEEARETVGYEFAIEPRDPGAAPGDDPDGIVVSGPDAENRETDEGETENATDDEDRTADDEEDGTTDDEDRTDDDEDRTDDDEDRTTDDEDRTADDGDRTADGE